jgi:hypothetical protein
MWAAVSPVLAQMWAAVSPVQRRCQWASFGCLAQALSDELVAHAGDAVHHADARNAHLHGSAQRTHGVLTVDCTVLTGYSARTARVLTGYSRGTHRGLQGYSRGTHGVLTTDCTVLHSTRIKGFECGNEDWHGRDAAVRNACLHTGGRAFESTCMRACVCARARVWLVHLIGRVCAVSVSASASALQTTP